MIRRRGGSTTESAIGVADARARLSQLIDRVEAGEEITLTRAGRPVARLVPHEGARRQAAPRVPGLWRDRVRLAPDWDSPAVNAALLVDASTSAALPDNWKQGFWGGPMPDWAEITRGRRTER